VTVYADSTIIGTISGVTILSGNSAIVTFTWNTTGFAKGNHTIWAYAWPVLDGIHIADNTFTDGRIFVSIVGDINGDRMVDLKDTFAVDLAYGSLRGTDGQYWHYIPCHCYPHSPNLDINDDGQIDLKDTFITDINYGKTW